MNKKLKDLVPAEGVAQAATMMAYGSCFNVVTKYNENAGSMTTYDGYVYLMCDTETITLTMNDVEEWLTTCRKHELRIEQEATNATAAATRTMDAWKSLGTRLMQASWPHAE